MSRDKKTEFVWAEAVEGLNAAMRVIVNEFGGGFELRSGPLKELHARLAELRDSAKVPTPTTGVPLPDEVLRVRARELLLELEKARTRTHLSINDFTTCIVALEEALNGERVLPRQPELKVEDYQRTRHEQGEIETHESFGMIGFSRVNSTGTTLFGSDLPRHPGYIQVTVQRARRQHSGVDSRFTYFAGRDFGDGSYYDNHLVTLLLSGQQFAEAITSMNMGEGVPCTLQRVRGVGMADVPELPTILDKIAGRVAERFDSPKKNVKALWAKLDGVLVASKATKKGQEAIKELFGEAVTRGIETAEWGSIQIEEATGAALHAMRVEMTESAQRLVTRLGLRSLEQYASIASGEESSPPKLPE